MRHARRQPADARELLVLDALGLVLAQRPRHPVELRGQVAQLPRVVLRDAHVQVPARQPRRALRQPRHRPRHRVADVDAHPGREQRGAAQEQQRPAEAVALHRAHVRLEGLHRRVRALRQRIHPRLDARHPLQRPSVRRLHRGRVLRHHRRQQRVPVEPVQRVTRRLDVRHRRALLRVACLLRQPPRQRLHARAGLGVEAPVAVVAQDDGVRQVRVLVAHRRGQLARLPRPAPHLAQGMRALMDVRQPAKHIARRRGEQRHQRAEREQQPAGGGAGDGAHRRPSYKRGAGRGPGLRACPPVAPSSFRRFIPLAPRPASRA
ncbi:hypothetical protein COSO111634_29115 [Corallococcus soli]